MDESPVASARSAVVCDGHGWPAAVRVSEAKARTLRRDFGIPVRRGRLVDAEFHGAYDVVVALWTCGLLSRKAAIARVRAVGYTAAGRWWLWQRQQRGMYRTWCYQLRYLAIIAGVDYMNTTTIGAVAISTKIKRNGAVAVRYARTGLSAPGAWIAVTPETHAAIETERRLATAMNIALTREQIELFQAIDRIYEHDLRTPNQIEQALLAAVAAVDIEGDQQ